MEPGKSADSVRAVDRALDILLAFRPGDDGLVVSELLKRVDLSRPTLYRLLATLEHNGFLVASGEPQRFRLGPAVAQLAHVWGAGLNLASLALPMMRGVREATQETVALFVPEGLHRQCVAELESPQALNFKRGIGYRERLVLGASGRVILAHMALDAAGLAAQAQGLEVDLAAYAAELARVRERGWAMSQDELIQGAVAVAAPFFDGADRVAGSICLFGPSVRLPQARVEAVSPVLMAAAAALSKALGRQESKPASSA
jgi:DNA-binding IclR family transcriptional regulator